MFKLSPRNLELNNFLCISLVYVYSLFYVFPVLFIPCYHLVFCVITLYLCPPRLLSSASVPYLSGSGHA